MRPDRRLALSLLLAVAGSSPAQTASDGAVQLSYVSPHWGGALLADLTGTEAQTGADALYQMGWFYRVNGLDTREYPFPVPDASSAAGHRLQATWNDLDGKRLRVVESTRVTDAEGPSGAVDSQILVANLSAAPLDLTLFHFANFDVGGTPQGDRGLPRARGWLEYAEGTDVVRYRGVAAEHFKMGSQFSDITGLLMDDDLDDLDDAVLTGSVLDACAAFQFRKVIPPGGTWAFEAVLSSRLPDSRCARGESSPGWPWPRLFFEAPDLDVPIWTMLRTSRDTSVGGFASTGGRHLVSAEDFDGDCRADLVLRHPTTGAITVGGAPLSGVGTPPASWQLAASGDFDRDRKADLVWRDTLTQELRIWTMDGARYTGTIVPNPSRAVDANWEVAGAEDFNGDGYRDLLWFNPASSRIVIWYMDSSVRRLRGAFTEPATVGGAGWRAVTAVDLGKGPGPGAEAGVPDIVWQNDFSKRLVVWHMNRAGARTSGTFTTPDRDPELLPLVGPR